MDHSHHDMAGMADMNMNMDMGHGPATGHRCSMSMLFTWNTQDLCLVFRWWHVHDAFSLVLSLLAVVALGMGYEYIRDLSRKYAARVDARAAAAVSSANGRGGTSGRGHVGKGIFYGVQVFYSFFIMLLFMTYNGWVMIAVAVGAFLGYIVWGGDSPAKSVACH
ncbi:Ctr copper transporter family-domain-containing protein [Geopyxis carbonaria]|nr:Ctr copper transporter family-domain-containing protein [Geopyxis carbonaria]